MTALRFVLAVLAAFTLAAGAFYIIDRVQQQHGDLIANCARQNDRQAALTDLMADLVLVNHHRIQLAPPGDSSIPGNKAARRRYLADLHHYVAAQRDVALNPHAADPRERVVVDCEAAY